MFGLLKAGIGFLFGGSDNESKGVDKVMGVAKGIGGFIDEQNFTEEERVRMQADHMQLVFKAVELTRDENSVRSVTRRVMAWAIMGTLLGSFWIALLEYLIFSTPADGIIKLVDQFMIGELSLAVGSFYFMASLVRSNKK